MLRTGGESPLRRHVNHWFTPPKSEPEELIMPEATNFEKYLAGAPLNEELAAIRRGEEPQPNPLAAIFENLAPRQLPMSDDDRPLSKEERLSLREAAQAGAVTT